MPAKNCLRYTLIFISFTLTRLSCGPLPLRFSYFKHPPAFFFLVLYPKMPSQSVFVSGMLSAVNCVYASAKCFSFLVQSDHLKSILIRWINRGGWSTLEDKIYMITVAAAANISYMKKNKQIGFENPLEDLAYLPDLRGFIFMFESCNPDRFLQLVVPGFFFSAGAWVQLVIWSSLASRGSASRATARCLFFALFLWQF